MPKIAIILILSLQVIAQRPRSAARAEGAGMNTANVHAGRLERRVRRVDRDIVSGHSWILLSFPIQRNTRSTAIAPYRVFTGVLISPQELPSQ